MIIDITKLNSNIINIIDINIHYHFSKDQLQGTDLLDLDCDINGYITKNNLNDYHLNVNLEGIMTIRCAITLEPTEYKFQVDIDDDIDNLLENGKNYTNSIDIFPIIWENILMEIPMRVVSDKAKDISLAGDGWKFTTDEEDSSSSPFDELKDLL